MPARRFKSSIIGLLLLALLPMLGGCNALRLGYGNGQQLTWWWLDGYLDFDRAQTAPAKQAIDRWFAWHRSTQLPEYASLLLQMQVQAQAAEPLTAEAVCSWQGRLQQALAPAIERGLQEAAAVLPLLGEAQFSHLEQRYAKAQEKARDEFLQPDRSRRLDASTQRTVERMERVYGRLDREQRALVRARLETAPLDAEAWLAERARRQADTVQTLRRLSAEKATPEAWLPVLRALVDRSERSQDTAYRIRQQALAEYNCRWTAELHNSMNPAQRQRARDTLKGWEDDLRALAATAGAPD